jgi:hypothetical protein
MRSRIPIVQARAKEIITELRKNKDILDLVLDEFVPLKDEAQQPAAGDKNAPRPTCKLEINKGEFCGAVEGDPIHGFEDHQHRFQIRKSRIKKALPDSVSKQIAENVKNARAIKSGDCVQCENPADANIHHLATTPGYHEFKEAA